MFTLRFPGFDQRSHHVWMFSGHGLRIMALVIIFLILLFWPVQGRGSGSLSHRNVAQPAATTNYVFFSVNGDTSATAMIQGDQVAWGANCSLGGSLHWSLVYDADSNGVISFPGDVLLVTFVTRDGDTSSAQDGPQDINPIPDGWWVSPPLTLGIAPGHYIFGALDPSDSSQAQRSLACSAMASPPNSFSGYLVVPFHPAPDPAFLKNRWVQAEGEVDKSHIWSALTNDSGRFTINVGAAGSGLPYRVGCPDLPGYVKPNAQMHVASGHVTGVDFLYTVPVDSAWGFVEDENHVVITDPVSLYCYPSFGSGGKDVTTQDGRYVFYFSLTELGPWTIGTNGEGLIPHYVLPPRFDFDNSVQHNVRHDLTCRTSDTVLFARVWEGGGLPVHHYEIDAWHSLSGMGTRGVSGIGTDNVVTLHIADLGTSDWGAFINTYSDHYPLPPGYFVGMNPGPFFGPGDTVDVAIDRALFVSDTIKSDPADPPPNWSGVQLSFSGPLVSGPLLDSPGVYSLFAMSGWCSISVFAPGYFVHPPSYDFVIMHDTVGGLGFEINRAHCRVQGALTQVPLPFTGLAEVQIFGDSSYPAHWVIVPVDIMTGQFSVYLCDGEWTLLAPYVPDYWAPDPLILNIANAPDTARQVEIAYTPATGIQDPGVDMRPREFVLEQNVPNPFNPSTVIRYFLPEPADVSLTIYNVLGERVCTLARGMQPAGEHTETWNAVLESGASAASGLYFYRLTAGPRVETRRMLLLR